MTKRYHVHVCYASGDLTAERSMLMQKFADTCFFTWNLHESSSTATNYARQQIDHCDYVIFLIGGLYGSLAASGVSYLHLEYIYATTKHKPMIVMMHEKPPEADDMLSANQSRIDYNARKLKDFREHISRENKNLHVFNSNVDFTNKVRDAFDAITREYQRSGWVRYQDAESTLSKTGEHRAINSSDELMLLGISKVSLNEMVSLNYKVHAFQDGNFKELDLVKDIAWGDVLAIAADALRMPVTDDVFAKLFNDYLDQHALKDVKVIMPRAHAAARSQLSARDVQRIKLQFAANEWLQTTDIAGTGKKQIMLSPQGARQVTQWRGVMVRLRSLND